MGNNRSKEFLSEEILEDYESLTYLSKSEILCLLKTFAKLGPEQISKNAQYRFLCTDVMELFPCLKYNPFRDRFFYVFSSFKDNRFSFEDFLDLCSVMSVNCPEKVKAKWAFKIYDFNNDNQLDKRDIAEVIDRLTCGYNKFIAQEDMEYIVNALLKTINIQTTGAISEHEFIHAVEKMTDFALTFHFSI